MNNQTERARLERLLQQVPAGEVQMARRSPSCREPVLWTAQFSARTEGRGRAEYYALFPGAEASYGAFCASEVRFHHPALPSVLELFYCRSGRVGWNMQDGTALYLGTGDMAVHSTACCADSAMLFPLGYAEGISFSIDLDRLAKECPDVLQQAETDFSRLRAVFCDGRPMVFPACPELESLFSLLYAVPHLRRGPYLNLKAQEILLYLSDLPAPPQQAQCDSRQTERIRQIHQQLTDHLEQRFTIEELARQYLMNTSTLKETFKVVYGLPIATYMKEYRIHRAMRLLRESDATIAQIAARVGYESQGKFTKAFKDVAQRLPSEYRRETRQ